MKGTLHEDKLLYMLSRRIILRMRNVSDKSCRENQHTLLMFKNSFRKSRPLGDNVAKYGTVCQTDCR